MKNYFNMYLNSGSMSTPLHKGSRVLRDEGVTTFAAKTRVHGLLPLRNTITSRHPFGTNIFDRDWDLLVILDSCRVDFLRHLSDSVDWIDNIGRMKSVGSTSVEWVLKTFTETYRKTIAETGYVTGNGWYNRVFDDQVHKDGQTDNIQRGWPHWDPVSSEAFAYRERVASVGNQNDLIHPETDCVPHILTDRAIDVGRKKDIDRLIVHYMFPHLEFIGDAVNWNPGETAQAELMTSLEDTRELRPEEQSYGPVKRGEVSRDTVRDAYRQNLRFVLEYVGILLENIDATKVVISSDHGEMLGEFGLWDHTFGNPFRPVKTVPWAITSATDEKTYESRYDRLERQPSKQERIDLLKNMGYL